LRSVKNVEGSQAIQVKVVSRQIFYLGNAKVCTDTWSMQFCSNIKCCYVKRRILWQMDCSTLIKAWIYILTMTNKAMVNSRKQGTRYWRNRL